MNRCDFKICDCALQCVAESRYSVYLLFTGTKVQKVTQVLSFLAFTGTNVQILTQVLSLLDFTGANVQILTQLALQLGRVAAAQHKSRTPTDARLAC
jgi:Tol biopolymer transport system component